VTRLRRIPLLWLIVVDLPGLLILDVILIVMLVGRDSGRWTSLRQEMVLAFAAAVILDVFVLRLRRWAYFARAGVAFVIAVAMVETYDLDPEPLTAVIAAWQFCLLVTCGWWSVRPPE
jgi:hypothetical protein